LVVHKKANILAFLCKKHYNKSIMAKKIAPLLPATDELLRQFGDRLRLARLRRRLTAKQVAERAGMAPMTLRSLEHGGWGVTIGAYLAVMQVLGIEKDLNLLGKADLVGRELQDARMHTRTKTARPTLSPPIQPPAAAKSQDVRDWIKHSDFANAQTLVDLIDPVAPSHTKVH
jgi:transcriptional regulator with XRE-family HTH domain